jgi:small subunit ribosomal protein S14
MTIFESIMWSKKLKDKIFRKNFKNAELSKLPLLFLLRNNNIDNLTKFLILKSFTKMNRKNYRTQIKNRCVVTLRARSPLKLFHISRILFRSFASSGLLLGIKKSS